MRVIDDAQGVFCVTCYAEAMFRIAYRLIPQAVVRWFCGRRGHRYVILDQHDDRCGQPCQHDEPSASRQLPGGVVIAVYSCRCGERQEVRRYGGQFPRLKS